MTAKCPAKPIAGKDEVQIPLASFNLADATAHIAVEALKRGGSIEEAAKLMGVTPNELKRIMDAHRIKCPRKSPRSLRMTTKVKHGKYR